MLEAASALIERIVLTNAYNEVIRRLKKSFIARWGLAKCKVFVLVLLHELAKFESGFNLIIK